MYEERFVFCSLTFHQILFVMMSFHELIAEPAVAMTQMQLYGQKRYQAASSIHSLNQFTFSSLKQE